MRKLLLFSRKLLLFIRVLPMSVYRTVKYAMTIPFWEWI